MSGFDLDTDLSEEFSDIVGGKKKGKSKSIDFEFSEKNAGSLDLGFKESVGKDPIEEGGKRAFGTKSSKKKKKSFSLGEF